MHVLDTCKNEENPIKTGGTRLAPTYLPLKLYMDFSRRPRAANSTVRGPIWPNFELIRGFKAVLVTFKNECARVVTTLHIDFQDAQWQLTP